MIELFQMEQCPFCVRVRLKLEELNIDYISKPSAPGSPNRDILQNLGGQQMVPFLHDPEENIRMYESLDIINYLENKYGNN